MQDLELLAKLAISPPPLTRGPELTWLLRRAFGPAGGALQKPDPKPTVDLAEELGLVGYLCRRVPLPRLEEELGLAAARRLVFLQLQLRAFNRDLAAALSRTAEIAQRERIPIVLLKHAALSWGGVVQEGERDARDIDVLASEGDAQRLWQLLREVGFRPLDVAGSRYHLTPLRADSGACIEIHHGVWGVQLADGRPVSARALVSSGATRLTNGVNVPRHDFLAAHAIVHGLAQHLTSPASYSPLRVISDLVSLGTERTAMPEIQRYCADPLGARSVGAVLQLVDALTAGDPPTTLDASAAQLLAHVMGASVDAHYRSALRAYRLWELYDEGDLLQAARRFFYRPSMKIEGAAPYNERTIGERAREAWRLAAGVVALAQLRIRATRSTTSASTSGNASSSARPKE